MWCGKRRWTLHHEGRRRGFYCTRRRRADGGDQRLHFRVGGEAEFGGQQCPVRLGVPQRARAIALREETRDDAQRLRPAERIDVGEAAPPVAGRGLIAAHRGLRGERLERSVKAPCQADAFVVGPPFEFRRIPDVDAVEERARVHCHGGRAFAT